MFDGEAPSKPLPREPEDAVLLMRGIGKKLWDQESGDDFVDRLRSEDAPPVVGGVDSSGLAEKVWQRIESHQGDEFHTATGLPFTFKVEGAGIWFFREGRRVNRKLARSQVEVAVSRCPITRTTEISDLMDYAYLFGLLHDPRIRSELW